MNTTTLKQASTYGGPMVFGAGAAMLAAALVSSARGPASAAPVPALTVTATAPAPVGRTTVAAPSARSSSPSSARAAEPRVVAAAAPRTTVRRPSPPAERPGAGAGAPSGPSPSPSPAASCDGSVLAVRLLRAACVSVGGGR